VSALPERPDAALAAKLDPILDTALAEGRVAGAVCLVAKGGALAYARAAGLADLDTKRPMAKDAIFRASSLTKPIVTAAFLALVEAEIMGLDDPVIRWLPDFRPQWQGEPPTITLRQLLTHTAGLSYGFMQPVDGPYLQLGVSDGMDQPGLGFPEELKRITQAGLFFPPGAAWLYSVSTDVLGAVMAEADGASLPEVVRRTVTGPLGLEHTDFVVKAVGRLSKPYADAQPEPVLMGASHSVPFAVSPLNYAPGRAFDAKAFPSGGAGMVGTAPDFLTFLETIRKGGAPILKPETVKLLTENQIGDIPVPIVGPGYGFSLGWAILTDPASTALPTPQSKGTWNWGGVYGGSWFVDPAKALSVVVLTNTAIEGMIGATPGAVREAVYAG
jgi:CubicO group peptidase (beta-lactamase class C family)